MLTVAAGRGGSGTLPAKVATVGDDSSHPDLVADPTIGNGCSQADGNRTDTFIVHMSMRVSLALAAAAIVLAACGGSSSTVTDAAADTADTADTGDAADASSASAGGTEEAPVDAPVDDSAATPGEESTDSAATDAAPVSVTPEEAAATAAENQPNLQVSDDPIDTEVLVVADGSVTTIAEAVTGDRPVLLWFWAPH